MSHDRPYPSLLIRISLQHEFCPMTPLKLITRFGLLLDRSLRIHMTVTVRQLLKRIVRHLA